MGDIVQKISRELKISVLMVEQHNGLIQQITQRGYVMDKGSIVADLTDADVRNAETLKQYLTV
ncbi:hypothetical protein SDC9_165842 [bioreactor metagenome]|uniref:Branched-chain amino acid ATP-binding cassette transporter C-terminal domain-containing protein n=1 Tax=bioreactor metagenome TaxID=1076179 RepID=A0A645FXP3_9ZZZZ